VVLAREAGHGVVVRGWCVGRAVVRGSCGHWCVIVLCVIVLCGGYIAAPPSTGSTTPVVAPAPGEAR